MQSYPRVAYNHQLILYLQNPLHPIYPLTITRCIQQQKTKMITTAKGMCRTSKNHAQHLTTKPISRIWVYQTPLPYHPSTSTYMWFTLVFAHICMTHTMVKHSAIFISSKNTWFQPILYLQNIMHLQISHMQHHIIKHVSKLFPTQDMFYTSGLLYTSKKTFSTQYGYTWYLIFRAPDILLVYSSQFDKTRIICPLHYNARPIS